jgi:bacteriocin leader peptide (microcyclamide/patellamide family)
VLSAIEQKSFCASIPFSTIKAHIQASTTTVEGTKTSNINKGKAKMENKDLMPMQVQPVARMNSGQLPSELAELSEELLQNQSVEQVSSGIYASSIWHDPTGCTQGCHHWCSAPWCSYSSDADE